MAPGVETYAGKRRFDIAVDDQPQNSIRGMARSGDPGAHRCGVRVAEYAAEREAVMSVAQGDHVRERAQSPAASHPHDRAGPTSCGGKASS